ncbi:MAG TPA: hypothetical protein VGO31_14640 [Microbacteriaceae bacterium]|nr:hypothetical protein [Microbacteriaceae bacterium]
MATDEAKNYVLVLYPDSEESAIEDGPDAYGPLALSDAMAARESVLRATPDVGIEIALLRDVADLFKKLPLP